MERQVADATKESNRLEAIAHGAPGVQAEYANLNRDYDVLYKDYVELLARREAMRLSSAAQTETEMVKLQIVDPPQIPRIPIGPKRKLMVTAVLGMGLAAGSALVVLLRQLDRSFQSVEDLQVFGLPVAGGVSLIGKRPPLQLRVFGVASFSSALLLLGIAYGALMIRLIGGVT